MRTTSFLRIALLPGMLAALSACSPRAEQTPAAPDATGSAAGSAAAGGADPAPPSAASRTPRPSTPLPNPDAARSEYTSLAARDCPRISRDEESGSESFACAGVAPYRLVLHDSDARQSLDVIAGEGKPQPLDLWSVASIGFSDLGERAEWRFPSGASEPNALIVRLNAYENPEQPDRTTSYLVVSKLGANPCVTAIIPPGAGQNEAARDAAERTAAACLGPRR